MKNFIDEFRDFALHGNVMDMAVGVIIGAAFKAIVDSFMENILNPILGLIVQVDFSQWVIKMGSTSLKLGAFISTIINFFLTALVLFLIVKEINHFHKPKTLEETVPVKSEEAAALEEIVSILKEKNG
jgi:large conductance mechanosensitive channel